jgi:hypothetical protein
MPSSRANVITAAFRGNCTAFLPRRFTPVELGWRGLPAELLGFPVRLTYRDVRSSLTGGERVFVAEYRPQPESFVHAGRFRKLSYGWSGGGPYHVDVLHDGNSGVWSIYKFRLGMLVAEVAGQGFGEAMIRATAIGLDPEEPAFTYIGDEEECRRENRAQAEVAARTAHVNQDWRGGGDARPHPLVFGMILRDGVSSLVFLPREVAIASAAAAEMLSGGDAGKLEWPDQSMAQWLPPEVWTEFGRAIAGPPGGVGKSGQRDEHIVLDWKRAPEILGALERAGYECICDEELVKRACGGHRG